MCANTLGRKCHSLTNGNLIIIEHFLGNLVIIVNR